MFYDYLAVVLMSVGLLGLVGDWISNDEDAVDAASEDESDLAYVQGDTVVTLTDAAGETAQETYGPADLTLAPTLTGGAGDDTIVATQSTGMALILEGQDGDDTIDFGYGASVDGGDGADVLNLSVQRNALLSDADIGTVDLIDTDDSLAITLADDTPGFVHRVVGQTTQTVADVAVQTRWIDYYVSDQDDLNSSNLNVDQTYPADIATRVVRVVVGEVSADQPDNLNTAPDITVNRSVASTTDISANVVS